MVLKRKSVFSQKPIIANEAILFPGSLLYDVVLILSFGWYLFGESHLYHKVVQHNS